METFLLAGRNYIGNDVLGRQCHHERVAWELAAAEAGLWPILLEQRRAAVANPYSGSMGREVTVLARAKEGQ